METMELKAIRPITNIDHFAHTLREGEVFVAPIRLAAHYLRTGRAEVHIPDLPVFVPPVYEAKVLFQSEDKTAEPVAQKRRRGRPRKVKT
ncbi:MAG TPA: hypothetical protein VMX97_15025 [Hyphomicrobiaceae bacterium]|nr:hypothetical protein [Hyphomicrobiaceae bacterium]